MRTPECLYKFEHLNDNTAICNRAQWQNAAGDADYDLPQSDERNPTGQQRDCCFRMVRLNRVRDDIKLEEQLLPSAR